MSKLTEKCFAFAEDFFLCDADEDGERPIWEPFEQFSQEDIDDMIMGLAQDVETLVLSELS